MATLSSASSSKLPRRPLPVPPPVPPVIKSTEIQPKQIENDAIESASNGERKRHRRKTKSLERIRDQTNDIELSDSDAEIINKPTLPIIITDDCKIAIDEPDASVASITITDTIAINSNTTVDEPAICIDTAISCNDATVSDRSQISYDEIIKIGNDSFDDDTVKIDLNDPIQSIIVDIHDEPMIELKIHEEGDSDRETPMVASLQGVFTKEYDHDVEQERCFSEDDAIGRDGNDVEKPERFVQSDSEALEKTPIELVVECDINENVILSDSKNSTAFDYNHNDVVKSNEIDDVVLSANDKINTLQTSQMANVEDEHVETNLIEENREPDELKRISISSRSSLNESDAFDTEPMYATIDAALQMVSF